MTNPLRLSWHVPEIKIPVLGGTRSYDKYRDRYTARTWTVQLVIESWNTTDFKSGAKGPLSSGRAILSDVPELLDTDANADVHIVFKETKIAVHSGKRTATKSVN